VFLINLEGNDMSDIPTSEEIKARQQRIKDWPKTITIAIAEWEAMRLDAERWNYFIETCSEEVAFYITGNGNADSDEINKCIDERRAIKEGN
jgi:hypothetical protein